MIFYIIKRVFQAAAVMILVAFISFVLFNYVGDPVNNMVGQDTTQAEREALRRLFSETLSEQAEAQSDSRPRIRSSEGHRENDHSKNERLRPSWASDSST